ncbi:MAG: gamma-glutamyltransferase, partial [Anaerolineae bacterium]|nr:gamma-glutamyltransferase [Anaerolineae bacterium]
MKPTTFDFQSRRSMVTARRGMVAASNPLAAQAGLNILRQGGNAADAAVAAAAVMNVTAPGSCGMGGDCFALYFDAAKRQITALNGSGRAPAALTLADMQARGYQEMPRFSAHAVTVPGAVQGWYDLLQRHGSMTLADVLVDAIHYADDGYPVSPVFGAAWKNSELFLKNSTNTEQYLPNGHAPEVGEIIQLKDLANTFRIVAEGGPEAYYQGKPGEAIVSTLRSLGGVMTMDDLKNHHSTWDEPILTNYRGISVYECPPNGQG